jgi:hypothetical protein
LSNGGVGDCYELYREEDIEPQNEGSPLEAKYWEELWGPRQSDLGMVFQLRNDSSSERWGGESEHESNTEFFVGLKMSVGFGE